MKDKDKDIKSNESEKELKSFFKKKRKTKDNEVFDNVKG